MTPTKQAVEAARERLAKAADDERLNVIAMQYREGTSDDQYELKALAIALQEMSDAVKHYTRDDAEVPCDLAQFILPEPVDPLVEAMSEAMCGVPGEDYAKPAADLREELAKRGLQIVPVQS